MRKEELEEIIAQLIDIVEHFGPPAPDHVCGGPMNRCDTMCVEYAHVQTIMLRAKKAIKDKEE